MSKISRQQLQNYLDDVLSESETAAVEHALRDSDALRRQVRTLLQERDRGEHSIGAVWVRCRLTCPTREQLGSFLLNVLDEGLHGYIQFHLHTIGCAYCLANFADLQRQHQEPAPKARERRRRYFESSAGLLNICKPKK